MKHQAGSTLPYLLICWMALSLSTCTDPFRPDLSGIESDNQLVVEGFITDEDISHRIRLTRTVAVNSENTSVPKESGAKVQVIDQDGNVHTLTEAGQGDYFTDQSTFKASAGNSYQLRIELSSGEIYESDLQDLISTQPIDSIWYALGQEEFIFDNTVLTKDVVKFYTNYDPHEETAYYRYDYFGTYAFRSELQGNTICWAGREQNIPTDLTSNELCYVFQSNRLPLNVSSYPDPVNGAPGFEEILALDHDERFIEGYSIAIRKYTLTEDYYNFLEAVVEQQNFGGSIFDSPPTQIIGNIRNVDDPSRFALGFFGTLSQNVKRIFIPAFGGKREEGYCDFEMDDPFLFVPPPADCCDCRAKSGSSAVKPDFWPN